MNEDLDWMLAFALKSTESQQDFHARVKKSVKLHILIMLTGPEPPGFRALHEELARTGYMPEFTWLDSELALREQLRVEPDLIIAEYDHPDSGADRVLDILQELGLEVPLIVLSRTMTWEDATECVARGAFLALPRARLSFLALAVARAIHQNIARKERRFLYQALSESEERNRELLRNLDEVVYAIDANGKPIGGEIVFVGDQAERIIGYAPDAFRRDPDLWLRNIHPEDAPEVLAATEQIVANRKAGTRTYRFRHGTTGEWRWIADRFTPVFDSSGGLRKIFGSVRDITERRAYEERLTRLSGAVEHAGDIVVIANRAGTIEYTNPAFTAATGYSREEAIGRTPRILKSGQHNRAFYRNLWDTVLSGKVFYAVFVNQRKNGELYSEAKTISPIRNKRGDITHFVSLGRDISQRVRMEQKFRYQANLLENLSYAIVATDEQLRITCWNKAAERIYGWTSDQVAGRSIGILGSQGLLEFNDIWEALVEHGKWEGAALHNRKDGGPVRVMSSVTLIRNEAGLEIGTVAVNREITEAQEPSWS